MYSIREHEHQELFTLGIQPCRPVAIHIPSPLGKLDYRVYVRVPEAQAALLDGTGAVVEVGGLRPDHEIIRPGVDVGIYASTQPGLVWRCIGTVAVSRGDGTVTFTHWPAEIATADLLLCTWPRFIESGQADEWIAAQADPQWAPSGVPLGGIGGGRVDLCRDGRFRNFSMNNNQDAPMEQPDGLPQAYLAVQVGETVVDLATRPIVGGHEACATLEFTPRFPQATLRAPQVFPGIDVAVTVSGTLCPHDLRRSAIPGLIVRWTVTNTSAAAQTVSCRMGWPNLVGIGGGIARAESGIGQGDGRYHYWDDPTGRAEFLVEDDAYVAVRYVGLPAPEYLSSAGEHLLGMLHSVEMNQFARSGGGEGELAAEMTVPAGASASATMALVVAMPHWVDARGTDRGMYWQNHFADGRAMLSALLAEADEILAETGALAALLDDSTLPAWLGRRLANCTYPLVTNSVFFRDGRFSINEGPTEMAGCYGTIDQRLAAHPATQLLFPMLNVQELSEFAAIQHENGGIAHDLGGGHLERGVGEMLWPDLTCSFIIQTARHAWSTGDAAFEAAMWPRAKRALLRHTLWAADGGGVAQVGNGLGTSYDGYHYVGTIGYMATLWLAALAVMEQWATRRGDADLLGQIPAWRAAALKRLDADLWNGSHYITYGNAQGVKRETCHAGQIAGQVFTRLLTGQDVLPAERLRACVDAVLALNGNARFGVPPDEVGADGEAAVEFGWLPYVEGFMLSAVASLGDERLWPLWARMMAAVDGDGKHPCDTRLMYRPSSGELSWGAYYMAAPASWLVYEAWLDFFYAPQEGTLRLRTDRPGRYPIVHPLFWATAEIAEDGAVTMTVRRVFTATPRQIVAVAGTGGQPCLPLDAPVLIEPGAVLRWTLA